MNRLQQFVLSLFAAPRLNMREDYGKVRRAQRWVASISMPWRRTPYRQTLVRLGDRSISVRVFQPQQRTRDDVLVFFHGGGWVTGDIETYTPACANMAELTGCAVASVNYRLAPEHPFPAGLNDCYGVAQQVLANPLAAGIDRAENIVLIGDSAGGNLAAATSLLLKERGQRAFSRQILLYPVTHWDHDPETSPFDSVREYGEGLRLTNTEIDDYFDLYVPEPMEQRGPLVSPLMADDLSGQPTTLILTAEQDLLRDEGEAYGQAIAAADGTAEVHRIPSALHGFIQLPKFSKPMREAYEHINAFLDAHPAPKVGA
ncbi:alpha/beta hydrolase [Gulosibacter molinativorax]|uniref:Alpha/beta hydrolase n=1 Tax=Gulosibacter molinativorax TaxID=256821 RepID=A0ABT7C6T7_9MICO|nr:alpha/beta hydrolase [Gulosibacter molinativorax]MDJ1370867.1 alpha/beta hydrolase [Gulosibacter molinativorax]QUY62204.1 Carboxylesterase NlhH [Gulosibacter molinativorax]